MAAIILVLCCLCCLSSSASFVGGFIPGTEPHLLKTLNAPKFKKIVEGLKIYKADQEEYEKKFADDDDERLRVLKISTDNLRVSDTCDRVREIIGNKFKPIYRDYPDKIFTLDGTKRKDDVWEKAIGIDDKFTPMNLDGGVRLCFEEIK
jgi:hypothetical protein